MLRFVFALTLFTSTGLYAQEITLDTTKAREELNTSDFVWQSLYYGLHRDQVSKGLVAKILEDGHFIPKCQICTPVKRALTDYKAELIPVTTGSLLPAELEKKLSSDDEDLEMEGLKLLVERYILEHIEVLGLNDFHSEMIKAELEVARKRGMTGVKDGSFCPSCDGACSKK